MPVGAGLGGGSIEVAAAFRGAAATNLFTTALQIELHERQLGHACGVCSDVGGDALQRYSTFEA